MKLLKFTLLFITLLIFGACEKEQIVNEEKPAAIEKADSHSNNLVCIFEPQQNNRRRASERHRFSNNLPVGDDGCFSIFITGGCDNFYTQATVNGIADFNDLLGTSINLTRVYNQNDADIIVLCENLGGGDCNGGSALLNNTTNQIEVRLHTGINTTDCFCNDNAPITSCDIQFIAMHEIGHALGFGHTDFGFLTLIPGTPTNDFFSIMNSGGLPNALCAGLCEFTPEDVNALEILYPANPPCGGSYSGNSSTQGYQIYPTVPFDLPPCNSASMATSSVFVQANDVPNRFRVVEVGGGTVVSSGWIGYSSQPGPWGSSLNGPSTKTLTFSTATGGSFYLEVETVVQGQSDAWSANINCGG